MVRIACTAVLVGQLALLCGGCSVEEPATLVAMVGCGLEGEELSEIRARARGDFPPTEGTELISTGGVASFQSVPDNTDAITVEGLFGDVVVASGRTARLAEDGELPVYFAPEDQLCAVASGVGPRMVGATAVGADGDVVVVGGTTPAGQLLDDVIHYRDVEGVVTPSTESLPFAAAGQSVHPLLDRRFMVIGGAAFSGSQASYALIDVSLAPDAITVGRAQALEIPGRAEPGRAHHAAGTLPNGVILVAGGCSESVGGACIPSPTSVLGTSFTVRERTEELVFKAAPDMGIPRYGADMLVGRDGVAFVVGGFNMDGERVRTIERLLPGAAAWEPYSPGVGSMAPADVAVVGAALLEGGLIVVAMADQTVFWLTDSAVGPLDQWCVENDDRCFVPPSDPTAPVLRRTLHVLPGERVIADTFLLPISLLAQTGNDALDLSQTRPGQIVPPPGQRVGAQMVGLNDGTVFFVGGQNPVDAAPIQPFFLRLRPSLDGPDERIPNVAGLAPGSMVLHDESRFQIIENALVMNTIDVGADFPSVWAHVRGFRSSSFRFDVTFVANANPHLVFSQGAVAGTSIRLDGKIRGVQRDASGSAVSFTCTDLGLDFTRPEGQRLQVEVDATRIEITVADTSTVAQCPGPGEDPVAVGIGASGTGSVRASSMRLSRI